MAGFEIKVKGLSDGIDEKKLREMFSEYGEVLRCTRLNWGAFVTMKNESEGAAAVKALNGQDIFGQKVIVHPHRKRGNLQTQRAVRRQSTTNSAAGARGATGSFINPYNFVPVAEVKQSDETVREYNKVGSHFQERFREDTLSGRVVCEIEAESDIFIGAGKAEPEDPGKNTPAKIAPFELDGQPAIPPSSIKGMLSSVMEAASNSALRALEKEVYTRRMEVRGEPLSKIGIVRRDNDKWYIEELPQDYIYLNRYSFDNRSNQFVANGTLNNPALKDYSVDPVFYYVRTDAINLPRRAHSHSYLVPDEGNLISQEGYNSLSQSEKNAYQQGIIKHFGVVGSDRDGDLPHNKKHEIFVPYMRPGGYVEISDEAMEGFDDLAKEAFKRDKRLPFTPFGRRSGSDKPVKLREGDCLYYRTVTRNEKTVVTKLSFSAIWRDFCGDKGEPSNTYGYFKQVDKNGFLLPPCMKNQDKTDPEDLCLTPASALMGFVEEEPAEKDKMALALAGRLFFSPGILSPGQDPGAVRLPEKTLKELASPKPPCPEFYFYNKNNPSAFITKKQLFPDDDKTYLPRGRKFYWHHQSHNDAYTTDENYIKDSYKRLCRVDPIKKGTRFLFSVDFFNLTRFELGMLLYGLRPTDKFRHQIGMGKPIGLGKIRIDILNLLLVDRNKRYGEDPLFSGGFFHSQTDAQKVRIEGIRNKFGDSARGKFNMRRFCTLASENTKDDSFSVGELKEEFVGKMTKLYGKGWFAPLETMGDPEATKMLDTPVQYPNLERGSMKESFKWWVENSRSGRKTLPFVPTSQDKKSISLPFDPSHKKRP